MRHRFDKEDIFLLQLLNPLSGGLCRKNLLNSAFGGTMQAVADKIRPVPTDEGYRQRALV